MVISQIGQPEATLSGGQKARVGLARAVYSNITHVSTDDKAR